MVSCSWSFASTFYFTIVWLLTDLRPWKPVQQCPHVMNVCAKFHSNPYTNHGDIASRRTTDGQPDNLETWCSPPTIVGEGIKSQGGTMSLLTYLPIITAVQNGQVKCVNELRMVYLVADVRRRWAWQKAWSCVWSRWLKAVSVRRSGWSSAATREHATTASLAVSRSCSPPLFSH